MSMLRFRRDGPHSQTYAQRTDDKPPPALSDRYPHWSHLWLVMDPPERCGTSLIPYAGGDDSERPKALVHRR